MNRVRTCFVFILAISVCPVPRAKAGDLPWAISVRRDLPLVTAGLGLTAAGHALAGKIPPVGQVQESSDHVFVLDRDLIFPYSTHWSRFSDAALVASVAAPLGAYIFATHYGGMDDLPQLGLLELETLSFAAGIMYVTKALTRRPRPYAYRSDTPVELLTSPDSRASFFSGHAALAFAAAELTRQFVISRDGPRWLAWGGYGLATVTGSGRVLAGVHFPTDVVVGALAGVVCAKTILALHEQEGGKQGSPGFSVGLLTVTVTF